MIVVALDLSLTATGVCYPGRGNGELRTETWKSRERGCARLAALETYFYTMLRTARPELVVIEGYAYGRGHAAHQVGELGGLVRLALWHRLIPMVVIAPAKLKRYATGRGNASKDQVLGAAVHRFGREFTDNNQADASWLYAMAMDGTGAPVVKMPVAHREALEGVDWTGLEAVR